MDSNNVCSYCIMEDSWLDNGQCPLYKTDICPFYYLTTCENEKEEIVNMSKADVNVNKLITTFVDMAERGTLLTGSNTSQNDLLMQIIGTIVKVAGEE